MLYFYDSYKCIYDRFLKAAVTCAALEVSLREGKLKGNLRSVDKARSHIQPLIQPL